VALIIKGHNINQTPPVSVGMRQPADTTNLSCLLEYTNKTLAVV